MFVSPSDNLSRLYDVLTRLRAEIVLARNNLLIQQDEATEAYLKSLKTQERQVSKTILDHETKAVRAEVTDSADNPRKGKQQDT